MNQIRTTDNPSRWGIAGAVIAALGAAACCLGPLVLLALGVGGAGASSLKVLDPYRPIFIAIAVVLLGFAFYRAYRKPAAAACEPDGSCAVPRAARINRIALWIAMPLILALLAFPYIAPQLFSGTSKPTTQGATNVLNKEAVLKLDGMTCAACTVHVRQSLTGVDGVQEAKVTLDPPQAVVSYDPAKASVEALEQATAKAGYPSSVTHEK